MKGKTRPRLEPASTVCTDAAGELSALTSRQLIRLHRERHQAINLHVNLMLMRV